MNPKAGLLLFFLTLTLLIGSYICAAQEEKPSVYKIELQRDGSAIWTVETRIKLESQSDIDAFNLYKAQFEANKSQNLANFSSSITTLVSEASTVTGRAMAARDFDAFLTVTSAPTGTYGVINYRFNWTSFAKIDGGDLKVGDVFAGGMYLSREEALIINPPAGFEAKETSPKPDDVRESAPIWYGMRGFSNGEPRVLFQSAGSMNLIYPGAVIALILIAAAFYIKAKGKKEVSEEKKPAGDVEKAEAIEAEAEAGEEKIEFSGQLLQSDEDLILDMLGKAGGEMYQSDIIEKTSFSKSKVSAILSDLKSKGLILKIKKGRENLIRLVR